MSGPERGRTAAALLTAAVALAGCARPPLRLDALASFPPVGAVERFGPGSLVSDTASETVSFSLAEDAEVALVSVAPSGRVAPLYPYAPGESSRFTAGRHTVSVPVTVEWLPDPDAGPAASNAVREMEAQQAYVRCLAILRPRRRPPTQPARAAGDTTAGRTEATPVVPGAEYAQAYSSDVEACGVAPAGGRTAFGAPGTFRVRNDVIVLVVSDAPLSADGLRRRVTGLRVRTIGDLRELPGWIAGQRRRPSAGYYSLRY
jgi:hypothetical protein